MDDEMKKLLLETRQMAQTPQKLPIQGQGPFELPLVDDVMIQNNQGLIVLGLRVANTGQRVFVPLTPEALATLGLLALAFQTNRGREN